MTEYDEQKAIAAMRGCLPESESKKYDDDQLLNIVDMIWDFYEQNGLLDIDADDDDSDEDESAIIDDLVEYVTRMLKKDKNAIVSPEHVRDLVLAEIAYEDSLALDL